MKSSKKKAQVMESDEYCTRGLEARATKESKQVRKLRRIDSLLAVLTEQCLQEEEVACIYDPIPIAKAYRNRVYSRECV